MKTRDQSRLASFLALLVGLWVILLPTWASMSSGAVVSAVITGAVIIVASVVQYFIEYVVPSWVLGVTALWLLVSSFIFTMSTGIAWSQVLAAIVTAVLAYWDGVEVMQLHHPRQHAAL